ncbi:MAG TPA: molybdopterin-dependent oxidoreductase [Stellaceae bacterium]|nr:molybdopterin-dependent oxidoreductase [Stellaceae bacterium]
MQAEMPSGGTYRRVPLAPHQRVDRITPTESCFVLAHMGVPRVAAEGWSFRVEGLVRNPLTVDLAALKAMPQTEIESFHQCAGAPKRADLPMRRVMNVVWGGVRLADILYRAGVLPEARFIWSYGLDHGTYDGHAVDNYAKDLPLARLDDSVLIATELNGAPLPPEHGFPARLLVPGYYGTNSVKWLDRIVLAARRADGPFTTALYNDPTEQGGTRPVWAVMPESAIVAPAPDARLGLGETEIWGWAWGALPIAAVEISTDGGESWTQAALEPRRQFAWQRFSLAWRPERLGPAVVMARARDEAGSVQPPAAARNAVHAVAVEITP